MSEDVLQLLLRRARRVAAVRMRCGAAAVVVCGRGAQGVTACDLQCAAVALALAPFGVQFPIERASEHAIQ